MLLCGAIWFGGDMSHSYKDLVVWQEAKALAIDVYRASQVFPKHEIYGLTSQLRRAAVSVVSNIAEGQGRLTKGEFVNFLSQSRGSVIELLTQLEIAQGLDYLASDRFELLEKQASTTLRLLNGLIGSLRAKAKSASANS
jgi:four helix bundle protein